MTSPIYNATKDTNQQKKAMVLLPLLVEVEYVLINMYLKPHVCN